MEQNTRYFVYGAPDEMHTGSINAETYDDGEYAGFYEEEYDEEYTGYEDERGIVEYSDEYESVPETAEEDYAVYNEELDSDHRFHVAMNAFHMASVFTGLVMVFVLTTLIITLVTWIQTDITHSFVLLQSGIQ